MKIKLVIGGLLIFFVMMFSLQNTEVVEIRFLFWQFSLSRALMIFLVLGIGFLIGWFLSGMSRKVWK